MEYDFCGWATKNDLLCADGRRIRKNAFAANDGKKVPLIYQHNHSNMSSVLGHAILENREEGVYVYGYLNDSPEGKAAKERLKHGDITNLSIYANQLQHDGHDVVSGNIREVSLAIAGSNPGAFIESVIAHGLPIDDGEDEGILYTNEKIELYHAEEPKKKKENPDNKRKTPAEILESMTDEQKQLVGVLVEQAASDAKKEDLDEKEKQARLRLLQKKEDDEKMKHSVFNNQQQPKSHLSHDDLTQIWNDGKRLGSLKAAVIQHLEDDNSALRHAIDTTGLETATGDQAYGVNDPSMLFPEATLVTPTPEWISRNMAWVDAVLSKTSKSPFARIKSVFANITEDEARAKGYIKGKMKKEEVFALLKRTTEPQTIYKKQKLDRDDIIDITGFDVLAWIRSEMDVMLNEEKARAILIGDGRLADDDDKIQPIHIRSICEDVALFNTKVDVTGSTGAELAKNFIYMAVKARKNYKGSGNPDLFTTEDLLTDMLLLENKNGDRIYKTEDELATALRVSSIYTVEPMEGTKVDSKELLGIIVNLIDYKVGSNKAGERTLFDAFDIDFNQQKYLLEERFSGALVKPYAALTFCKSGTTTSTYTTTN